MIAWRLYMENATGWISTTQGDARHAGAAPAGSALELLCIMYASFKRIEPGMDIGADLGEARGRGESEGV
jgi:hypothetical protein